VLVHLEIDEEDLPRQYQLLKIGVDKNIDIEEIEESSLSVDWMEELAATRKLGDDWIKRASSAMLRVPSAITPQTHNWLLNPSHDDMRKVRIIETGRYPFDSRLFRKSR
jgi:RES domain-containing protein